MKQPLLQIALDNLEISEAIEGTQSLIEEIDIVEVGTILIAAQGQKSIQAIKKAFPDKIIIADGKIADAGAVFARIFFESGADYITCICAAETATIAQSLKVAHQYGPDKDVQIELTSHFTWKQVQEWKAVGIKQAIYHRSRDAQARGKKWTAFDLAQIKKLISYGFQVSVTGGLTAPDLAFFQGLPIFAFIAGRAIRDAVNPALVAQEFKAEIRKYW